MEPDIYKATIKPELKEMLAMRSIPLRLVGNAATILIAAGVATLTALSADAATVSKVRHHTKHHASVAVKPLAVTPNLTLDSNGHTKRCLKADFKDHQCPYGDMLPRYGHPADDDGPWWEGVWHAGA
jgi:hypothetical protein